GLLVVERAQALEVPAAGRLERHPLGDHVDDRGALAHQPDVLVADLACHGRRSPPAYILPCRRQDRRAGRSVPAAGTAATATAAEQHGEHDEYDDQHRADRDPQHRPTAHRRAPGGRTACTPTTWFTTCVTRRSTATLASATASRRATPCSRPSSANIASSASKAASSRLAPRPIVSQPAGVCATGPVSGKSSRTSKVSSTRSIGHSSA